jgi:tetratricopeptide (TPR) repeat protein
MHRLKNGILCLISTLLMYGTVNAQLTRRDMRKYNKASARYVHNKLDEAEKLLQPLSAKYPQSAAIWNLLAQVQMLNYYNKTETEKLFSFSAGNMTITGTSGEVKRNDSLTGALVSLLNDNRPSKNYLKKSSESWREATLRCEDAELPSVFLRTFFLDTTLDTTPRQNAIKEFNMGEAAFQKQNYTDAISHYQNAIDLDSSFYKARVYMGDAYYSKQDYIVASKYFREAIRLKPNLQEPRKYLVDALYHMHAFQDAEKEAVEALLVYPDVGMFLKLKEVVKAENKHFDRHWMERGVFPNTVGDQPLNEKGDRDWMEYINGFSLIEKYCDKDGIIVQKNDLSKSHYAEVFSWEYMLKKTSSEKFPFARKMQQAGFLDCYVMLSEYHYDFNAQFQHFSKHNRERLKSYVELLMSM